MNCINKMKRSRNWLRLASFGALAKLGRAEEKSILDMGGVTVSSYEIDLAYSSNNNALIDKSFKTMWITTAGNKREVVISLGSSKKVVTVFVLNASFDMVDNNRRRDIDESYIWVGDGNVMPYSVTGMTKNPTRVRDSGFIKIDPILEGFFVALRRDANCYSCTALGSQPMSLYEMRVYQVPNLLHLLEGTATASSNATAASGTSIEALITNLEWRSNGSAKRMKNNFPDSVGSCFSIDEAGLTAVNYQVEITFDLKESYFQHSFLWVSKIGTGLGTSDYNERYPAKLYRNIEVYIHNTAVPTASDKCPGGPFLDRTPGSSDYTLTTWSG